MRTLFGYAVLAVVGFLALKLVFGLFSIAFGFLMMVLWLAAIGFVFYLVLTLVSPSTARRVREMLTGRMAA